MVAKIHSRRIILRGLWLYFAGSCHWWDPLCWWGRKQRSAGDLSQGCHQREPSLMAVPPQPPLNSHGVSTIPSFLGDTRASCGPPNRHPVPRGLSGQRAGICAVSPEVLSPQILPPASAN